MMIDLNWLYKEGIEVVENNDVKTPMLFVPSHIFYKLKDQLEKEAERQENG